VKLSKRGEYALRALIDLGIASELGWPMLQIGELASKEKLPIKFLEQIFTQLKSAGYVASRRGKFGGYSLARPMSRIKFGAVIRLIDGPLAPIRCVSQTSYARCSCPDENHCGLRMLMFDVRNVISTILDRYTLADIVEITLRKYRRDKITPPFLKRSIPLASILSKEGGTDNSWQKQGGSIKAFFRLPREPVTERPLKNRGKIGEIMFIDKLILLGAGTGLTAIVLLAASPLWAQTSSESKELEELKREIAELRAEVNSLKKQRTPHVTADEGPTKTEINYDGKSYVEKTVPLEKSAADKWNYLLPLPRWNSTAMRASVTITEEARPRIGVHWPGPVLASQE
jgi:Rrf2 family protein